MLSKTKRYESQTVCSCFITGFKHKPTHFMRTIPNISNQVKQLDGIVRTALIKATWGGINFSGILRKLLSFPPKLGSSHLNFLSNSRQRVQVFENDLERLYFDTSQANPKYHCQTVKRR